eukprot:jgi/Antlo1/1094/2476
MDTAQQQHHVDEQTKDFLHPSHSSASLQYTRSVCVQKSDSTARCIIESVEVTAQNDSTFITTFTDNKKQPMYLQRMVCLGMQVLCCLGTQDISMHPDESALTVHLSNEYKVKSVEERGDIYKEKTYRFDTCVQWDRDVFGRAVKMLGRQQVHVDVEKMETILRAMADLSTDTESAHVHNTRREVEVLWNRDAFGRAVRTHGGRLQSKVDGEEVEAILHAMAYQSTGKVDILHVSEYMEKIAKRDGESYEIRCDAEIFEKTYNIMIGNEQEKVNAGDMVDILHVMDYLGIRKEWEWACYDKLGRKTKEDHKRARQKSAIEEIKVSGKEEESIGRRPWNFLLYTQDLRQLYVERKTKEDNKEAAIGDIEEIRKELAEDPKKTSNFFLYTQHLLRLYAEEHGMSLTVDEKRKTLDLRRSHSKKEQRENRTDDWELIVEASEEYRGQTEVQRLVEVLMEVMGIVVKIEIEEWKPEDREMLERIVCKAQETELRIKSSEEHTKKQNLVELDVTWNRRLSNEDWKIVGEMARLEKLDMRGYNIQAGGDCTASAETEEQSCGVGCLVEQKPKRRRLEDSGRDDKA